MDTARHSPRQKQEGHWSRTVSRKARSCFWDSIMGTRRSAIGQYFSLSLVTTPEVFAKVKFAQCPSQFYNGDLRTLTSYIRCPGGLK